MGHAGQLREKPAQLCLPSSQPFFRRLCSWLQVTSQVMCDGKGPASPGRKDGVRVERPGGWCGVLHGTTGTSQAGVEPEVQAGGGQLSRGLTPQRGRAREEGALVCVSEGAPALILLSAGSSPSVDGGCVT